VLGIGTTVIPAGSGSLADYMASLERLRAEAPARIYPAHGPLVADGRAKIDEYIAHRHAREREIVAVLERGPARVADVVRVVYAAYPEKLWPAAAQSVGHHLRKLEREGRAACDGEDAATALWRLR
jgi:glyoxylase-like metal-dependent hydrolase (beta-lactamase superfamily II)